MAQSKFVKQQSTDDLVAQALGQFAETKSRKQRKTRAGDHPLKSWQGIVLGVVALIAVLMLDGLRREGAEYRARIVNTNGQVWVMPNGKTTSAYVVKGATVTNGDLVATGPNSTAVLAFSEGSTVVLEPSTQFKVRMIDYDRRGIRDRSFMLSAGRIWSQVSESFGNNNSQMDVCTPTAVAAVRGTVFSVGYDERTQATNVNVGRGKVGFSAPGGRYDGDNPLEPGKAATAVGYKMGGRVEMTAELLAEAQRYQQMLTSPEYQAQPSVLQAAERKVAGVVYVPLGWVGVGPKSWITKSFDAGIRSRTEQALKQLRDNIMSTLNEGQSDFPEFINPLTLEELKIPEKDRNRILLTFAGGRLELYQQYGRGYRFTVFAKDSQRTAYELNDKGTYKIDALRARTLLKYDGSNSNLDLGR